MSAPRRSLRSQLLRWVLIPLSLLFLLDAAASYFVATRMSDRVYDGELLEIARELVLHVKRTGASLEFDLESDAERTLLLDQYDKVYYAVRAPGGALVAGDAELAQPSATRAGPQFYGSELHGEPLRAVRLNAGADTRGSPTVVVAETLNKRHALAEEIVVDVILPQLLLIVNAALLVWAGVSRGLAPLRHLQQAVAARSHLDLSPVAAAGVPGEVHPLVQAINELMARLDEVLSFQNRFIADAAHQLRTPVAGLKAHIEVALRGARHAAQARPVAHRPGLRGRAGAGADQRRRGASHRAHQQPARQRDSLQP